jgi:hypothetical protein
LDNKGGKEGDIPEIIRDREGEYYISSVGYTLAYNKMALRSKLLDEKVVEPARKMVKKVRNNAYVAKKTRCCNCSNFLFSELLKKLYNLLCIQQCIVHAVFTSLSTLGKWDASCCAITLSKK